MLQQVLPVLSRGSGSHNFYSYNLLMIKTAKAKKCLIALRNRQLYLSEEQIFRCRSGFWNCWLLVLWQLLLEIISSTRTGVHVKIMTHSHRSHIEYYFPLRAYGFLLNVCHAWGLELHKISSFKAHHTMVCIEPKPKGYESNKPVFFYLSLVYRVQNNSCMGS